MEERKPYWSYAFESEKAFDEHFEDIQQTQKLVREEREALQKVNSMSSDITDAKNEIAGKKYWDKDIEQFVDRIKIELDFEQDKLNLIAYNKALADAYRVRLVFLKKEISKAKRGKK